MAKKTDTKVKPAAAAKPAATPVKRKAPAAKAKAKPVAEAKPVVTAKPVAKTPKPKAPAYTNEDVSLRAYFIAEKRRMNGIPGDEHQDWIEAERQLAVEKIPAKKTKKS